MFQLISHIFVACIEEDRLGEQAQQPVPSVYNQKMVSITMQQWQGLIRDLNITETIIPTRPPVQGLRDGAKWYG
jgi:hypothetical protein